MTEKYLFGDTDLAAERLRVLADVFAGTTRDFLLAATPTEQKGIRWRLRQIVFERGS